MACPIRGAVNYFIKVEMLVYLDFFPKELSCQNNYANKRMKACGYSCTVQ